MTSTHTKTGIFLTVALLLNAQTALCTTATTTTSTAKSYITTAAKNASIIALAASMIRFWTREGDNDPVRYNFDELLAGENIGENLFYLYDDGVIGHFAKGSYLMHNPNAKPGVDKTKVSEAVAPKGIFGYVATYYKGIIAGLGAMWVASTIIDILATDEVKKNPDLFCSKFMDAVRKQYEEFGMPNWLALGWHAPIEPVKDAKPAAPKPQGNPAANPAK